MRQARAKTARIAHAVRVIGILNLVLLFMSAVSAQANGQAVARIQNIHVTRDGGDLKIQVDLTNPVTPNVIVATAPDRLVLELPETTATAKQRRIAVNQNGVMRVRVGLNSADPPVTRVVVDLAGPRTYKLAATANTVTLTVLPQATATQSSQKDVGAVPAGSAPLIGRLWQRQENAKPAKQKKIAAKVEAKPSQSAVVHQAVKGPRSSFKVKYVAEGAAYLDGGRSSGLAEGMKLEVRDLPASGAPGPGAVVAELQIVSVAETSAVTDIHDVKRDVKPGDWALSLRGRFQADQR